MPRKDARTHAQANGLGKDEVDPKPAAKIQVGQKEGDNGIEQRCQGKGGDDPLGV
jgi:hypothetical protein